MISTLHFNKNKPKTIYYMNTERFECWRHKIPRGIAHLPIWTAWAWRWNAVKQKWFKMPFNPTDGSAAKCNDPSTWCTLNETLDGFYNKPGLYDGIQFALRKEDGIFSIDLDDCVNYQKSDDSIYYDFEEDLADWAYDTVCKFQETYIEFSPSGTGLRILGYGNLPVDAGHIKVVKNEEGEKIGQIEVFDDAHFMSITCTPIINHSLENCSAELLEWHGETFTTLPVPIMGETRSSPLISDDAALLKRAFASANGDDIKHLYNSSPTGEDDSRDEQRLLRFLAFWTQDVVQLDRLMRNSSRYRPKWDSVTSTGTYGSDKIHKTLSTQSAIWNPNHSHEAPPTSRLMDTTIVDEVTHSNTTTSHTTDSARTTIDAANAQVFEERLKFTETNTSIATPSQDRAGGATLRLTDSTIQQTTNVSNIADEAANTEEQSSQKFNVLRRISELNAEPPRQYIIENLIHDDALIGLIGPSGHGKSFLALDVAASIAGGSEWNGLKVKKGRVIYIAAEAAYNFKDRYAAWKNGHPEIDSVEIEKNLMVVTQSIQMWKGSDLKPLLDDLNLLPLMPVLVIIDTLAASNIGRDENSTKDASEFIAACDKVRELTKGAIMVLHHVGASGEREKGSTVFRDRCDTMMRVNQNKNGVIALSSIKRRDSKPFEPMGFKLQPSINSAYLIPCELQAVTSGDSQGLTATDRLKLNKMRAFGKPMALKNVKILFDIPDKEERTLQRWLTKMVEGKHLEREGNGIYSRYITPIQPQLETDTYDDGDIFDDNDK